ncbi:MAG: response regulator [Pyrinomonadaceae bacterium]
MKTILIIDDDPEIRSLLHDVLTADGYQVLEAADGKQGLASYAHFQTDLIITDLVMPEKEGIETIVELRQKFPAVKIIVLSGSGATDLRMAKLLGADRAMSKPFDISDLLNSVKEVLHSGT